MKYKDKDCHCQGIIEVLNTYKKDVWMKVINYDFLMLEGLMSQVEA